MMLASSEIIDIFKLHISGVADIPKILFPLITSGYQQLLDLPLDLFNVLIKKAHKLCYHIFV